MARFDPPAFGTQSKADTMPAPVRGGNIAPPNGWGGRPLKQLVITTEPDGAQNGAGAISTQPVVEVRNALGVKIGAATDNVTVEILSGWGALAGTLTVAAVAGVATFTDLEVTSYDGNPVHLIFKAPGAYPARSYAGTAVLPGVAYALRIVTEPVGAASEAVLSVQPVVEILDLVGLRATGDDTTDCVATAAVGSDSTLSGTDTVTAVAGLITYTDLILTTAGDSTLTFSVAGLDPVDSATVTTAA